MLQKHKGKLTLVPAGPRCPSGPFIQSRNTERHKAWAAMHTNVQRKQQCACRAICCGILSAEHYANSLVGLGVQKSLLRLFDLCRHALQGRQLHPGNNRTIWRGGFMWIFELSWNCVRILYYSWTFYNKTLSPLSPFSCPWMSAC